VRTPTGEIVTALAPDDHPHHRGIFFGWHDSEFRTPVNLDNYGPHKPLRALNITKADFWGWGAFATRDGRVVENREVKLVRSDARQAALEIRNNWNVGTRTMAEEVNLASVAERDGVFVLDLEYRITPSADYVLNRASFGWFDVQGRKDGESYFRRRVGQARPRRRPLLAARSQLAAGAVVRLQHPAQRQRKTVGFAVIDHADNPYTTWHNSSKLWMLNPVITASGPITIFRGQTMTLRYRVVVHDGDTPTALIERLAAEWRTTK
jgi:hypothetical protein